MSLTTFLFPNSRWEEHKVPNPRREVRVGRIRVRLGQTQFGETEPRLNPLNQTRVMSQLFVNLR